MYELIVSALTVAPLLPIVTAAILPTATVEPVNSAPVLPIVTADTLVAVNAVNAPDSGVTLPILVFCIPEPTYKLPVIPAPPCTCSAPDVELIAGLPLTKAMLPALIGS